MASSFSSPWPDPNSPVLSKINLGVPLPELFKWLEVRDTLLGHNFKTQDITKAVALAQDCKHPDAVWLSSVCKDVSSIDQAREVFLSHQDDARALCFAWHLTEDHSTDISLLRRAAEMGYAFATSSLCDEILDEGIKFRLAQQAAAQGERDGFALLGFLFRARIGCEAGSPTEENFLIAAELGYVSSVEDYLDFMDVSDPSCWIWLSRAAQRGAPELFLRCFPNQVMRFYGSRKECVVLCLIGRALKGNIDLDQKEIFGTNFLVNSCIDSANQAVRFYDSQINSARLAVDTWTLVGIKLRVVKDVRILIGKMIWEGRYESKYVLKTVVKTVA